MLKKSLYRVESLKTGSSKLVKYMLGILAVQEVSSFIHKGIISAVKRIGLIY
jgi:hypothetical protein